MQLPAASSRSRATRVAIAVVAQVLVAGAATTPTYGQGPAVEPPPLVTDRSGPVRVPVGGDTVGVHDPVLAEEDGVYHLFSTGGGLQERTSTDLVHWTKVAAVFDHIPGWVAKELPENPGDLWAPEVRFWAGQWHLYYAASVWLPEKPPTRNSAIGHATSPTLDRNDPAYAWTDHGPVVQSRGVFTPDVDSSGWNAIDPDLVIDEHGDPWLAWGSAFDGIFVQRLGPDGALLAGSTPVGLARRGVWFVVVEAATLVHRDGWWWLFASYDSCCQGLRSNYNVRVGRSASIDGTYLDRDGRPLWSPRTVGGVDDDGGTPVLGGYDEVHGPGHQDVWSDGTASWLVHHWYDPVVDGSPNLGIRPLDWPTDGWPVARGWEATIVPPNSPVPLATVPTAVPGAPPPPVVRPRFTA